MRLSLLDALAEAAARLYELQSFLIALVANFEFELPDRPPNIR